MARWGERGFLVGTCLVGSENEIHCVTNTRGSNELRCAFIIPQASPVYALAPLNAGCLVGSSNGVSSAITRYTNTNVENAKEGSGMEQNWTYEVSYATSGLVRAVLSTDFSESDNAEMLHSQISQVSEMVLVCENQWSVLDAQGLLVHTGTLNQKANDACLLTPQVLVGAVGGCLVCFDLRGSLSQSQSQSLSLSTPMSHKRSKHGLVCAVSRGVDEWSLLSGGDDGAVCGWDTRKPNEPVWRCYRGSKGANASAVGHHHWVSAIEVRKKKCASSSTNGEVLLWDLSAAGDGGTVVKPEKMLTDQDESVYALSWSRDASLLATLGYDGRVVVTREG